MAYFIGLMSGTSMDGVDAVLCDITDNQIQSLACTSLPYPDSLLTVLQTLCHPGNDELNCMAMADREVAHVFATAVNQLLEQQNLRPDDILAIGSHGQTVRHQPATKTKPGYSLQIGDPNTIAALTNIDVIADFRRRDIAEGGQGAPLAPAFHQQVFSSDSTTRAIINIGGIANITYLPKDKSNNVIGFDTGPGNRLMDYWCQLHTGNAFDRGGEWAASGQVNEYILDAMLEDKYFKQVPPKSTGREYFNEHWLTKFVTVKNASAADIQATLLELTAYTIADSIKQLGDVKEIFVCGGGAYNQQLLQSLSLLSGLDILSTDMLGLHPQWVEGAAFAWLAWAFKQRVAGNLPAVTGANKACVLGAFFPA